MTQKLHELLETRNRNEQAEKVAALLKTAQAPVIDLVIRYDGRIKMVVDVLPVGGNIPLNDGLAILEGARQFLLNKQRAVTQVHAEEPETEV